MKNIKWLITLANGKPILFAVALLLIGVMYLFTMINKKEEENRACYEERRLMQFEYDRKLDSISVFYTKEVQKLNIEVKAMFTYMLDDYKEQLLEQKNLNNKVRTTISQNRKLLNTAQKLLKP